MEKTYENKFFEMFSRGGVVDSCIKWMRYKYSRPLLKPIDTKAVPDDVDERCQKLESKIWEWTNDREYDFLGGLYHDDSPLINEIESNLKECSTEDEMERYVYSLLKHFGQAGCNCSVVFAPAGEINRLDAEIKKSANEKKTCPKENVAELQKMIEHYKEQREWILQSFSFFEYTGSQAFLIDFGTPEYMFGYFQDIVSEFATRLDVILLENHMDLMKLQKESGLYVQMSRNESKLAKYLGSETLARRYVEEVTQRKNEDVDKNGLEPFSPLSCEIEDYLPGLKKSMENEGIIDSISLFQFMSYIYFADFKQMSVFARQKRNQNRLFLVISRISSWFPREWATKAAMTMGTTIERIEKVSPTEIQKAHPKWYKNLDKVCPKNNHLQ